MAKRRSGRSIAIFRVRTFASSPEKKAGVDLDVTDLSRAAVEPGQQCALAAGIEDIRVIGILCNIAALASAYRIGITEARLDGVVTR
jgi:hypothetical protein